MTKLIVAVHNFANAPKKLTIQAMYVLRNIKARSRNHCCRGKAINITYFCVGGRGFTGAVVCLRACSHTNPACKAPPYCLLRPLWLHHIFRHYLTNGTILGKKVIGCKTCILIFSALFFIILIILGIIQQDILSYMWKRLHVKYPLFFSDFNETWVFMPDFRKKFKCSILSKSVLWEPSCSTRTDMTKLIVTSRNFANASKI
jgi:hypothetical protein